MIRNYLIIHILFLSVFLVAAYFLNGQEYILSFACGSLVMGFNVVALMWVWHLIFIKKHIALGALFVVIKYALLGVIIYILSQQDSIHLLPLVLGTLIFIPSLFALIIRYPNLKDNLSDSF